MTKPEKYAVTNRYARKIAFQSYAAECDTYPLGFDPELTDHLVGRIAHEVRRAFMARFPKHGRPPRTDAVRTWLENQGEYTPFVDDVAVRRAVDFDWKVYGALSADERKAVGAVLSRMDEPYGPLWRDDEMRPAVVQPARRVRWMGGTDAQRAMVRRWVHSAYRSAGRAVVAEQVAA